MLLCQLVSVSDPRFIQEGRLTDVFWSQLTCFTVDNVKDLQLLLEQHIDQVRPSAFVWAVPSLTDLSRPQFETDALGCLLLTISAVLSRSVEKYVPLFLFFFTAVTEQDEPLCTIISAVAFLRVREDMDVSTATLIGAHGYCTQVGHPHPLRLPALSTGFYCRWRSQTAAVPQELVNLLLCGRAVSNVFDDDVELDTGDGNTTLLKGIKGRCDIGLLSLFEHYNICKVSDGPAH